MAVSNRSSSESLSLEEDENMPIAVRAPGGMAVSDLLSAPSQTSLEGASSKASTPKVAHKMPASNTTSVVDDRPSSSSRASSSPKDQKLGQSPSMPTHETVAAYQYTAMQQVIEDREKVEYKLTIREQPKHSRMCGVGEKADRRPIDPAPIVQLRVIVHDHGPPSQEVGNDGKDNDDEVLPMTVSDSPAAKSPTTSSTTKGGVLSSTTSLSGATTFRRGIPVRTKWGPGWENKTWYLENPYYFMYAMLADADTDEELHLLQDGKTRYTTGSCVSCLYHLKDIDGTEQGFFVFPDLSIRVEGRYRLKLCLFETIGHEVYHCRSVYSQPFNVYTAKRFPGMEESTQLSRTFADQGLKVRVRKNPRTRRGRISGKRKDIVESDDDSDERIRATETPTVYSHRPSITAMKRMRSSEGQQPWQSNEQQQQQQQQYQQKQSHSASYNNLQRPSEYTFAGQPQQYRRHQSPLRERRYTDSIVGPSEQRPMQMSASEAAIRRSQDMSMQQSGGGARYPLSIHSMQQQQHDHTPQLQHQHQQHLHAMHSHRGDAYRNEAYQEDGYHRFAQGSMDMDRRMRYSEQPQQYSYHRQEVDPRDDYSRAGQQLARSLPSGLPGLSLSADDYSSRGGAIGADNRTILPPLHLAYSSQQQSSSIFNREVRPRPSSGGTSPRTINASATPFARRMPPVPMPGNSNNNKIINNNNSTVSTAQLPNKDEGPKRA